MACLATLLALQTDTAAAQGRDAALATHADSVRGADNPNRSWWDVAFYDLHVRVNPSDTSFAGWNRITYRAVQALSLIHISEPTRQEAISYAVFCL